jgi:RNA polymerase sigma-54 factor
LLKNQSGDILALSAMYFGLYPVTTTTVTTHIIVTSSLLALTNAELDAQVDAEIAENPALEMVESLRCPRCGTLLERPPCLRCMRELIAGNVVNVDDGFRPAGRQSNDDFDPMLQVVQPKRLADHILEQLRPLLEVEDILIATYLAESLDERGLLAVSVEEAAAELKVSQDRVESVLLDLQHVDPVGVGSRGPQECLLRQLDTLPADVNGLTFLKPVAQRMLADHWDSFLHARWEDIPIPAQQRTAALAFIRANLTPYPALAGWEGELARQRGPSSPTVFSRPDMVIYENSEGKLAVEIFSMRPQWLKISPSFKEMIRTTNGSGDESWREMVERARLFIKCIGQRQQTLYRAVEALVSIEEKALREGDEHIKPLTRTQLAEILDVHEATVSRAIMGKTAALPDRRIVPLSHFFESGKSTKEMIRRMINAEDDPLSDSAIASRLEALGRPIARRTVAKYRNMLGILPVHLRARQREQVAA